MTSMIQQELQSSSMSSSSSSSSSSWSTSTSTPHGCYTNFEYISRHQLSSNHQPIITMTGDTTTTTTTNHPGICTTPLSIKRLEIQSNTRRQTRLVLSSLLKVKRNLTNASLRPRRRRSGSSLLSTSSSSSLSSDSSSATMIIRKSPLSTRCCYNQLNVSNDETELELSAYKKRRPSQSNYENQIMSPIHAVRPPPPIPSIMPKPIMTSSRTDLVLLSPPSPPDLQWQPMAMALAFTNNTYGIHMPSTSSPAPALQQQATNTSRDELDRFVELNKYRFERIKTKRKPNLVNKRLVDLVSCSRQPRVTRCHICLV